MISTAAFVCDTLHEAHTTTEFKNISFLNPTSSAVDASRFSAGLATHFTALYEDEILSGVFHKDPSRVQRIKDRFVRAARYIDQKTARGIFGDDGDKSDVFALAMDHAQLSLKAVYGLDEAAARQLGDRASQDSASVFSLLLTEVLKEYPKSQGCVVGFPLPSPSPSPPPPPPTAAAAAQGIATLHITAQTGVKTGWLVMKSRTWRLYPSWKPQYFVLQGDKQLCYFDPSNRSRKIGSMSLTNATVRSINVAGRQHTFMIITENNELVYLEGDNADTVASWIQAVETVVKM